MVLSLRVARRRYGAVLLLGLTWLSGTATPGTGRHACCNSPRPVALAHAGLADRATGSVPHDGQHGCKPGCNRGCCELRGEHTAILAVGAPTVPMLIVQLPFVLPAAGIQAAALQARPAPRIHGPPLYLRHASLLI